MSKSHPESEALKPEYLNSSEQPEQLTISSALSSEDLKNRERMILTDQRQVCLNKLQYQRPLSALQRESHLGDIVLIEKKLSELDGKGGDNG